MKRRRGEDEPPDGGSQDDDGNEDELASAAHARFDECGPRAGSVAQAFRTSEQQG